MQKYVITAQELKAIIRLYQLYNPFMTTNRIYSRWKLEKIKILVDYELWPKEEFDKLVKELQ